MFNALEWQKKISNKCTIIHLYLQHLFLLYSLMSVIHSVISATQLWLWAQMFHPPAVKIFFWWGPEISVLLIGSPHIERKLKRHQSPVWKVFGTVKCRAAPRTVRDVAENEHGLHLISRSTTGGFITSLCLPSSIFKYVSVHTVNILVLHYLPLPLPLPLCVFSWLFRH